MLRKDCGNTTIVSVQGKNFSIFVETTLLDRSLTLYLILWKHV